MATRLAEAWQSSNGSIVAVRAKDGGWVYFLGMKTTVNGEVLENNPVIAREISTMNLELMEAKRNA